MSKAREIAEELRSLAGHNVPNLFESAARELDRLTAFESAFFSMMQILQAYAAMNAELDKKLRKAIGDA
jgi:hypothetical protein